MEYAYHNSKETKVIATVAVHVKQDDLREDVEHSQEDVCYP